jgi:hypothetical protein
MSPPFCELTSRLTWGPNTVSPRRSYAPSAWFRRRRRFGDARGRWRRSKGNRNALKHGDFTAEGLDKPAHDRALRRAFKLRAKLSADGGIGDYILKPKWMRWRTYERATARIDKAEEAVEAHTAFLLDRLKQTGLDI